MSEYLATIAFFFIGWAIINWLSTVGYREVAGKFGQKRRVAVTDPKRYWLSLRFIGDIQRNKICHGKYNLRGVYALVITAYVFLNFGNIFTALPSANLWKFNRDMALRAPFGSPYLSLISVKYHVGDVPKLKNPTDFDRVRLFVSKWFVTLGFYSWYAPLMLANLNRLSDKLFPHSELAVLVAKIILRDKTLPDEYRRVSQLSPNVVEIDYGGNPTNGVPFVVAKDHIAKGAYFNFATVDYRSTPGKVRITFSNTPKIAFGTNGKTAEAAQNRPMYLYAIRTGRALPSGDNEIKIGHTINPKQAQSGYGRGNSDPRFILLVRETETFNEKSVHDALIDFYQEPADGNRGEFYQECNGLWKIVEKMLKKEPEEIIKSSILPEGIFDLA